MRKRRSLDVRRKAQPSQGHSQIPRIKSWLYEVVNPLIEALDIELYRLRTDGGVIWRQGTDDFDGFRHIKEYLNPDAYPIHDDFVTEHSKFGTDFKRHDDLLDSMAQIARKHGEKLNSSEAFLAKWRELRQTSVGKTLGPGTDQGIYDEKYLVAMIAQNVVNQMKELPSRYIDSAFWHGFRDYFLDLADKQLVLEQGRAIKILGDQTGKIVKELRELRTRFCKTYGIPAAPVRLTRMDSEEE